MTELDENAPAPLEVLSWPVRTARLSIRRATPADEDAMWAYRALMRSAGGPVITPAMGMTGVRF